MTAQPLVPDWVSPSAVQIFDLNWLAYRAAQEQGSMRAKGIVHTLTWLYGNEAAPITHRPTQRVTKPLAEYERWAATTVMYTGGPVTPVPLELLARTLDVPYLPERVSDQDWSAGIYEVLSWVTAYGLAEPPMPIPIRGSDGAPLTEHEIKTRILAQPSYRLPEKRTEAERHAAVLARSNRELCALIAETVRREVRTTIGSPDEQLVTAEEWLAAHANEPSGNPHRDGDPSVPPGERLYTFLPSWRRPGQR